MDVANLVYPRTLERPSSSHADGPRHRLSMASVKQSLREPLVHFLILGTLLFFVYKWTGGSVSAGSNQIVITHGQVADMAVGFARSWQRPANEAELKGLIDEHVKDEIAVREAVAMGLDRDDTIIRRRLRQKLEFLTEDAVASNPPTDAELQAFMMRHPDSFRTEPQVAFREVYVNADRRGASAVADADKLLARLRAAGPKATTDHLGDPTMLPAEQELTTLRDVARSFGDDFANQLTKIEPGIWTGPVESSFGLHLVLVQKRVEPYVPKLADVRPLVEREFLAERRKAELQALYDRLSKKYTITMEKSVAVPTASAVPAGSAAR
jgi:parvulin-like peptidyl-prolyl cis-trans isomerase-like protein